MFEFKRNGRNVTVEVEANTGIASRFYQFTMDMGDENYAFLIRENFDHFMRDKVKKIRQEEYERGWADAKAKRRKETWFAWSVL